MSKRAAVAGLLAVLIGAASASAADQITANNGGETWGNRKQTTANGKILWFDGTAVWLYDGSTIVQVQAHGMLGNVADHVFMLGSGSTGSEVVGAWRRGTDFAWVTINGNPPVQVTATNPINAADPTNPEAVAVGDGCVFMALQAFSGGNAVQHIFRIDPVTGAATNLTGTSAVPGRGSQIATSQCRAVWLFDDRPLPVTGDAVYKLHYYNGSTVTTIDTGTGQPHIYQGKIVYSKMVNGAVNVYLYDTNLPSPASVPLTRYTSTAYRSQGVLTDGRHVAFTRETNASASRQIVLAGGVPYTDSTNKLPDGGLFGQLGYFPFQLHRGQFYWKDFGGVHRVGDASGIIVPTIAPATTVTDPWLADGYLAWLGTSSDGGSDAEVFRLTLNTPTSTSPPLAIVASPLVGAITVAWEEILGAASYNLYMAEVSGVTKDNYQSLPGGTKFTGVTPPYTVTGLENGKTYYFVATVVEGAESGSSRQASATVSQDGWSRVYGTSEAPFNDVRADLQNSSILYAAATDSVGVWKSTDGGNNWSQLSGAINGRDVRAVAANGSTVIAVTRDGDILRSGDGGTSWNVVADGEDIGEQQKSLLIDPSNPSIMYAGDIRLTPFADNFVVKSTNGGLNWTQLPDSAAGEIRAYSLSRDPSIGAIYASGTGVPVAKSVDGGTTWTDVSPQGGYFYANASAAGVTYAAGVDFSQTPLGIFKTVNGGTSWSPVSTGLPSSRVNAIVIDPSNSNTLLAATNAGVYVTTNGGTSWAVGPAAVVSGYTSSSAVIASALAMLSSRRAVATTAAGLYLTSFAGAPQVDSVTPSSGSASGGTAATVNGSGFVAASGLRVLFGGTDAVVNLGGSSSTAISVTTPAHSSGSVSVQVINPDGQSDVLASAFTYQACVYTISPLFANYASGSVTAATVQVTTSTGCAWTATAPPGSFVTITSGASGSGSGTVVYNVAANGGASARSTTLNIALRSFTVTQSGAGQPAITLTATANSASQVSLAWTSAPAASSYTILRSQSGGSFGVVTSTAGLSYNDVSVTGGIGYVYRILAMQSSSELAYSNVDLAVPFNYTDPVLTAMTTLIRAAHFTELRDAINAARTAAGWSSFSFTDAITPGVIVKAIHLQEMRTNVDTVRSAFGLAPLSYTDPALLTIIRRAHIQELRDGLR